jgi:hypothetical protein
VLPCDVDRRVEGGDVLDGEFAGASGGEKGGGEAGENGGVERVSEVEVVTESSDDVDSVGLAGRAFRGWGSEGSCRFEQRVGFVSVGRPLQAVQSVPRVDAAEVVGDRAACVDAGEGGNEGGEDFGGGWGALFLGDGLEVAERVVGE